MSRLARYGDLLKAQWAVPQIEYILGILFLRRQFIRNDQNCFDVRGTMIYTLLERRSIPKITNLQTNLRFSKFD